MRAETEVLHSLARVLRATEKDGVGASRGAEGELVEGEALTAGLGDAGAGGGGEAEGADGHLRDLEEADIVSHAGDSGDGLALVGLGGGGLEDGTGDLGKGDPGGVLLVCFSRSQLSRCRIRSAVGLAHAQTAEDGLVELGVGAASQL